MADPLSALQRCLKPGEYGQPEPVGITLSEITGFTLTQIAGWPDTLAAAGAAAAEMAGSDGAPGPGRAIHGKDGALLRIEPLKWWLIRETEGGDAPALSGKIGAVLDLSSSRTWVRMTGPKAATLISHFLPLDLRPASFPDGAVASTAFHHVGVTLWRAEKAFNLLLPRSFAVSLWELLTESATQYGLEVREDDH